MLLRLAVVSGMLAFPSSLFAMAPDNPTGSDNPLVVRRRCKEAWVNPCHGGAGEVGCPDKPYLTIADAIVGLIGASVSPTEPGIVHLDAGVYSPTTNFEPMPIYMEPNISIRGLGAKECVIRHQYIDDEATKPSYVYYPEVPPGATYGPGDGPGWWQHRYVIIDTDHLEIPPGQTGNYIEFIDGVTFQGGDVQVYLAAELQNEEVTFRVSNCVFDMLDYSSDWGQALDNVVPSDVTGPDFGLLVVNQVLTPPGSPVCPTDPNLFTGVQYLDMPSSVLNNTFVMHWYASGDPSTPWLAVSAKAEAVAICDAGDPKNEDCDQRIRGISKLNIQNNLIRSTDNQWPMMGIDARDSTCSVCLVQTTTTPAPTNAFDSALYASGGGLVLDANTRFGVYRGSKPVTVIDQLGSGGRDPAFVGEYITTLAAGGSGERYRDWRVLPDSAIKDKGALPTSTSGPWILRASNGTEYVDPAFGTSGSSVTVNTDGLSHSCFVFDGEGYGNERLHGSFVDIGFDETSDYVHAGYMNDARAFDHAGPIACGFEGEAPNLVDEYNITPSGFPHREYSNHTPAGTGPVLGVFDWGFTGNCDIADECVDCDNPYFAVSSIHFGNALPTLLSGGPPPPIDWLMNTPGLGTPNGCAVTQDLVTFSPSAGSYTPPVGGGGAHTGFFVFIGTSPENGAVGRYYSRQIADVPQENVVRLKRNTQSFLSRRTSD